MSDLACLAEIIRLALDGPISVNPDGTVFRIVDVDSASEEISLTKAQKAAVRRALDPRRQENIINVQIHGENTIVDEVAAIAYRTGYEAGLVEGRRRPPF